MGLEVSGFDLLGPPPSGPLFCAIALPRKVDEKASGCVARLCSDVRGKPHARFVRWSKVDSFGVNVRHLTYLDARRFKLRVALPSSGARAAASLPALFWVDQGLPGASETVHPAHEISLRAL